MKKSQDNITTLIGLIITCIITVITTSLVSAQTPEITTTQEVVTTQEEVVEVEDNGLLEYSLLQLSVTNTIDVLQGGDTTTYQMMYENVSNQDIEEVTFLVGLPPELEFVDVSRGNYSSTLHAITLEQDQVRSGGEGEVFITTKIFPQEREGVPVVLTAQATYRNPTNGAQEDAFAYDIDKVFTGAENVAPSQFAATVANVPLLPHTLIGWLLVLVVLMALVLFGRQFTDNYTSKKTNKNPDLTPEFEPVYMGHLGQ